MPKKLPFYQQLLSTNRPIVDKNNFTSQIGISQYNIDKKLNTLKTVKNQEKKEDLQYDLDNYKAQQIFHDNNPLAFNRKKQPTSVPYTSREILNGLGSGIENFYKIPKLGELNEFVNPLHIVSSGIITPWAQAPLQSQQSNSLLPYGLAATSTALTVPFVKPSVGTIKNTLNLPRKVGQVYRDIKYPTNTIIKNNKVFHNSYDFLNKNQFPNGLSQKELNFLNNEIEQRGILEQQRRHPFDIRSAISKKAIVAEDYNMKKIAKEFIPNIFSKQSTVNAKHELGPIRVNAFNQYLGIPTKNTVYRIHSQSFKNNSGLLYTIPDKLLNYSNAPMHQKFNIDEFNILKSIEKGYKYNNPTLKQQLTNDLQNRYLDIPILKKGPLTPDDYLSNPLVDYGKPIFNKNKTIVPGWDYITNTAGGAPFIIKGNNVTMKDVWDINPFSRKKLPNFLKKFDAAPLLGGKNFTLQQDYKYLKNMNQIKQLNVPKIKLANEL